MQKKRARECARANARFPEPLKTPRFPYTNHIMCDRNTSFFNFHTHSSTYEEAESTLACTRHTASQRRKPHLASCSYVRERTDQNSLKFRKIFDFFFLHIRLDLVEFASQMVLFSKFRVDTAENGPVKVEKVQFSKHHFSRLSANFSILSSFTVRTRRDLPPGSENFLKIYSKMTKKFSEKSEKMRKMKKTTPEKCLKK